MEFLAQLWLPIVVSSVAVFIVSSIIHMFTPMHKNDVKKMDNEDAVLESLRTHGIGPGDYIFPGCHSMKEVGTDEFKAKIEKGPVGWLTILPPGGWNMNRSLVQWFVYCCFVGVFTAYIAWNALEPGSSYLDVFQITGGIAFVTYGLGSAPGSIWKGVSWGVTAKFMVDGLLYALATAGVFGWLWPALESAAGTLPTG